MTSSWKERADADLHREGDRHGNRLLYDALVELFKREGFAGVTVLRGVTGFGAHSVYHTDKLLRLSRDLPVVVEFVDSRRGSTG
jgi:PII-like signaling protein